MIFFQLERIIGTGVAVLVAALLLRWLWNITVPQMFGLSQVSYWQVFRLLLMIGIAVESVLFIVGLLSAGSPIL